MSKNTQITAKKSEAKRDNTVSHVRKNEEFKTVDSPVDQVLYLQRTIGNQAVQRLFKSGVIQAKLKIGKPGNKYEKEADSVADIVMRMPEPKILRQTEEEEEEELIQPKPIAEQITPLVQRQVEPEEKEEEKPVQTKPLDAQITPLAQRQVEPEEEEEEEELLQTKKVSGQTSEATSSLESHINTLKGGGQPLAHSTRDYFESRFGRDFSKVRVHTGSKAGESAKSINAKAFTTGKDVVFGYGQYSPDTATGKHLLIHELTHVVQQSLRKNSDLVQTKLIVEGKEYKYTDKPVQWTLDYFKIGETGRNYLKSILKSKSDHEYGRWGMLGYDLRAKDTLETAALETSKKITFAGEQYKPRFTLDERYWKRIEDDKFQVKGDDYAKAFNAIFSNPEKNRLECRGLSEVMALRAFHLSVRDAQFNWMIKRVLGKETLTIPLNEKLLGPSYNLEATLKTHTYAGEQVFRPGDIVAFSATKIPQSKGTLWQVENAIVVGWNDRGELLFVGGGLNKTYTEEGMKKEICDQIGVPATHENMDKIALFKSVRRLSILGGGKKGPSGNKDVGGTDLVRACLTKTNRI